MDKKTEIQTEKWTKRQKYKQKDGWKNENTSVFANT